MPKFTLLIVLLFSIMLSCKTDTKPEPQKLTTPKVVNQVPATKPGYPKMPNDLLLKMWDEGQMIDFVFHDLPFSMNQNEQASIRTNLTYIADKAVDRIPTKCKPISRQFYQVNGEIIYEADVYFGEGCEFYVFWVDGKPKYSNYMAETGIAFFKNMIQKAMQTRQKIGQGQQPQ